MRRLSSRAFLACVVLVPLYMLGQDSVAPSPVMNICTGNETRHCATPPIAIKQADPQPPAPPSSLTSGKKKHKGYAIFAIVLGADGHVHDVQVLHPVGHGLDELAVKAIKTWEFKPATYRGSPVASSMKVRIEFVLY